MRRGKFQPERWRRAQELAEQGVYLTEATRQIGIHWSTGIYISRRMGFKWPRRCAEFKRNKPEPAERVERMMRLACK